jgi:CBS domain protein
MGLAHRQVTACFRGLMKLSDTTGLVLKSKNENKVLSVGPDQSVYEAIEKMSEHGIGALPLSLTINWSASCRSGTMPQSNPHRPFFKGHVGPADHDQRGGLCESAAHR